jgi:hypothetical protein
MQHLGCFCQWACGFKQIKLAPRVLSIQSAAPGRNMVWHMARFKVDTRTESGITISCHFNALHLRLMDGPLREVGRVASRAAQIPEGVSNAVARMMHDG